MIPPKRGKNPRKSRDIQLPERDKFPRSADPGTSFLKKPSWGFSLLDMNGPYGWRTANKGDFVRVFEHLRNMEKLKLSEILGERHRGNHQVRPNQLSSKAQHRLKKLGMAPDKLISLRLDGSTRIWLIQEGLVLSLLWWDPYHLVWPSGKTK